METRTLKTLFGDKSSQVWRMMLGDPDRKWTTLDFAKKGVSLGLVSEVLSRGEAAGYVERVRKGRESYSRLIRKENVLSDWTRNYTFDRNPHTYYFYPAADFLKVLTGYLKGKGVRYALTLYSATRMIAPYVKDDRHFVYLDLDREKFMPFLKEMEIQTGLLKLVRGGNICFAMPFYHSSVFEHSRKIKEYPVVSNLQLYLDLMGFPPTGREELEHLTAYYKRKGEPFV